jgi:AraC-like DNA-binding protein/mannose-6-phosphate isomerase-like protein (cupin superfamily)
VSAPVPAVPPADLLLPPEQSQWSDGDSALDAVRSLVGEFVIPRLSAGAVDVFTSDGVLARGRTTNGGEVSKVSEDDELSSQSSERLPSRYVLPRHKHEYFEVCWVIEGRCLLWLDGRTVQMTPQRACIIQPGETHHVLPTGQLGPFRTLWWLATQRGLVLDAGTFAQGHRQATATFVELPYPVPPLIEAAVDELRWRRPQHALFTRLRLLEVAAAVLRALDEASGHPVEGLTSDAGQPRTAWFVHRLMQYVQSSHGPDVTLGQLAAVVGFSPNYVTTLFRVSTGQSLMAYVNEVRHRHAADLLRTTTMTVADVARAAGYNDPFYFDRVFRRREGCPPLAYRRLFRPPL